MYFSSKHPPSRAPSDLDREVRAAIPQVSLAKYNPPVGVCMVGMFFEGMTSRTDRTYQIIVAEVTTVLPNTHREIQSVSTSYLDRICHRLHLLRAQPAVVTMVVSCINIRPPSRVDVFVDEPVFT